MKIRVKCLLVAATFGLNCVAHAAGLTDTTDPSALEAYVTQAQQIQPAQVQGRVGQSEKLPDNLAALPSTQGAAGNANSGLSADTNRQILAELIGIHTTLQQLLERANAAAASH